jgi:glycosyltransferase involved in cell wall biosynthesis
MRIAQLAPLSESVPPQTYGGTELVVSLLTEGLVKNGHDVTLFASGDSETAAKLISVTDRSLRSDTTIPIRRWQSYDICSLIELEKRQSEFDIIHNHMGYQAFSFIKDFKCANVTTNHNIVKDYCAPIYFRYAKLPLVAISESYKALNYPDKLNYFATIYNGIDISQYTFTSSTKRTYLLFIGRICNDKGTATAIEIALALGLPLKIAGKVDDADKNYFQDKVEPLLSNPKIEYLGEVGLIEKVKLYSEAIAVLYPIAFEEPFGLVMAEALATGTPVAAFNRGSVKEIIADRQTGIVTNNKDELINRFDDIAKISHQACRDRALNLFSSQQMVAEYEKVYELLCR